MTIEQLLTNYQELKASKSIYSKNELTTKISEMVHSLLYLTTNQNIDYSFSDIKELNDLVSWCNKKIFFQINLRIKIFKLHYRLSSIYDKKIEFFNNNQPLPADLINLIIHSYLNNRDATTLRTLFPTYNRNTLCLDMVAKINKGIILKESKRFTRPFLKTYGHLITTFHLKWPTLGHLNYCKNVRCLFIYDLPQNLLYPEFAHIIRALLHRKLVLLSISNSHINVGKAYLVSRTKQIETLRYLRLPNNGIDDTGISVITHEHKKIRHLFLPGNNITEIGEQLIRNNLPNLKTLQTTWPETNDAKDAKH